MKKYRVLILLIIFSFVCAVTCHAQNPVQVSQPQWFLKYIKEGPYTTATLPATASCVGCLVYNSDIRNYEFSDGTGWHVFSGGGASVDSIYQHADSLFYLNGSSQRYVGKWVTQADSTVTFVTPTQLNDSLAQFIKVAPVSSVFGRTGAITAQAGDYSAFYYPLAGNPSNFLTTISGIAAGGGLSGTYPNPTVVFSNGYSLYDLRYLKIVDSLTAFVTPTQLNNFVGDYLQIINGKVTQGSSIAGTANPSKTLGNGISDITSQNTSLNNQGSTGTLSSFKTVTNYDNPGGTNLNSIHASSNSTLVLPVQSATSNVIHEFVNTGVATSETRFSNFNNALSNPFLREETNGKYGPNVALVSFKDWDSAGTGNNWHIAARLPHYNAVYQPPTNGFDSFHVMYTGTILSTPGSLFDEHHFVFHDVPDLKNSFHTCDTCDILWYRGQGDIERHDDSTILLNNLPIGVSVNTVGIDANKRLVRTTGGGGVAFGAITGNVVDQTNLYDTILNRVPIFNILNYGAIDDDNTDCTPAIQTAINAAYLVNGIVYIPSARKGFKISGALKTVDNEGNTLNIPSQLYIPYTPITDTTHHVVIMGQAPPNSYTDFADHAQPHSGALLHSTLNATSGFVFGSTTNNYTEITFRNLYIMTRSKTSLGADTIGTMGGIDAHEILMFNAYNNRINNESNQATGLQPASTAIAIVCPKVNNWAIVNVSYNVINNMFTGLMINEHTEGISNYVSTCVNGIEFTAGFHSEHFDKQLLQWNKYQLKISGAVAFNFDNLDLEDYQGAAHGLTDRWFNTLLDIYEPSKTGSFGNIYYRRIVSNVGADDNNFPVSATISDSIFYNHLGYFIPPYTFKKQAVGAIDYYQNVLGVNRYAVVAMNSPVLNGAGGYVMQRNGSNLWGLVSDPNAVYTNAVGLYNYTSGKNNLYVDSSGKVSIGDDAFNSASLIAGSNVNIPSGKKLGIGFSTTPAYPLHITGATANVAYLNSSTGNTRLIIDNTSGSPNAGIDLHENGTPTWVLASYSGGRFTFYNQTAGAEALGFDNTSNATFAAGIKDNNFSTGSASNGLYLDASGNFIKGAVPLTATPTLDQTLTAGNSSSLGISAGNYTGNYIALSTQSTSPTAITGQTLLFRDSLGQVAWRNSPAAGGYISSFGLPSGGLTGHRTYTTPNASGTLIITSDTSAHALTTINSGLNNGSIVQVRTLTDIGTSLSLGPFIFSHITSEDSTFLAQASRTIGFNYVQRGVGGRTTQQLTGTDSSLFSVKSTIPLYNTMPAGSILLLECIAADIIAADTTVSTTTTYSAQLATSLDTAIINKGWPSGNIILYLPSYLNPVITLTTEGNTAYRHTTYSSATATVAASKGVLFYDGWSDFYTAYNLNNALLNKDSIHLTSAGQRVAGTELSTYITAHFPIYDYLTPVLNVYNAASISGGLSVGNNINVGNQINTKSISVGSNSLFTGFEVHNNTVYLQNAGGGGSTAMVLGANTSSPLTVSDSTNKQGIISFWPYSSGTSPFGGISYKNSISVNELDLGGLPNNQSFTQTSFYNSASVTDIAPAEISRIAATGFSTFKKITGSGNFTASAGGSNGMALNMAARTITDSSTAASTNVSKEIAHSFGISTFAATNTAVTATDAINLYIAGAAANGTNFTGSNLWSLYINAGNVKISTVTSGTWQGTAVASGFGGTGFTNYTKGDIISATATNTLSKLSIGTTKQKLGVVSGVATWMDTLAITQGSGITVTAGVVAASGLTGSNFSNAAANTVFGNNTGSSTAPSFQTSLNLSGSGTFATGISLGLTGKISITEGTNASVGQATLSGGTVTVSTTAVTANSRIFLTDATTGSLTNIGTPTVGTIVAGTSFVINSTNVLDASKVNWFIIN